MQYFVVKPKNAQGRLPTLLWIHGGPIGMTARSWHWRWNPMLAVAQGYAVVQPNPRGSTGFGEPFVQGIWGNVWGDQCYKDLMAVTDAVATRPDVDPNRIMAMGGSFSGCMTNWIGTQTQRFKCLITHACVTTMAQFTGTTDHPAWWYLEMGGEDPYADPSAYDRYAPIRHIKQWKTPALIIHGEKDYRCPIGEGLNLFEALQYHRRAVRAAGVAGREPLDHEAAQYRRVVRHGVELHKTPSFVRSRLRNVASRREAWLRSGRVRTSSEHRRPQIAARRSF